jgi:hypothetical protein
MVSQQENLCPTALLDINIFHATKHRTTVVMKSPYFWGYNAIKSIKRTDFLGEYIVSIFKRGAPSEKQRMKPAQNSSTLKMEMTFFSETSVDFELVAKRCC